MELTESQRRAIEHDGRNLQLIACAGSGKTEVVARRVVHLLRPGRPGSLLPRNIVAFTFTDKAAAELKERIATRTRQELGGITGMAEMFVGTIHAFCLELLKSESPKHLKFEVLNEVQQGLFVDRHSTRSGLTTSTDLNGAALRRYRDTGHYITALSILREAERHDAQLQGCSLLDGLAEVHVGAVWSDIADASEVPRLVETYLHAPYAFPAPRRQREASAERVLLNDLADNAGLFSKIEFSETQIEIGLRHGVSISGRIDLVRRTDAGEVTIADFKSTDRAQAEDVTEAHLLTDRGRRVDASVPNQRVRPRP